MTNDVPEEDGGHPKVVTNQQLRKIGLFGVTVIALLIGFTSTWFTMEQNIDFNEEEYSRLTMDDALEERETTSVVMIDYWGGGNLESTSDVTSEENDEIAIEYDRTADTKDRTKNLFLGSLLLCIIGLFMLAAKSNVEFESEQMPYIPFLFAGLVLLATTTQFAITYDPYDSSFPEDTSLETECEEEDESGILLWGEATGEKCNADAFQAVGFDDWNQQAKSQAGIGFYASIVAGVLLIAIYFGREKSTPELFVIVQEEEGFVTPNQVSVEVGTIADQPETTTEVTEEPVEVTSPLQVQNHEPSITKYDVLIDEESDEPAIEAPVNHSRNLAIILVVFAIFGSVLMYQGGVFNQWIYDYEIADARGVTTAGSNDNLLLIRNFNQQYEYDDISIAIEVSNYSYQCTFDGDSGCQISSGDGVGNGWSKHEVWIIRESGVNICDGGCYIDIDIFLDDKLLEADGAEGITIR